MFRILALTHSAESHPISEIQAQVMASEIHLVLKKSRLLK